MKAGCKKASRLISIILDGEGGASEETALREHLERCPLCRKDQAEQRRLMEILASVGNVRQPEGYSENLRRRLRERTFDSAASGRAGSSLFFRISSIAAMIILMVAVCFLSFELVKAGNTIARLKILTQEKGIFIAIPLLSMLLVVTITCNLVRRA